MNGRLERSLGRWSLAFVLIGIMVGSGIFRVPSVVAAEAGSVAGIAGVWILGGALALCGALCYAEMASRHPDPGGAYVYLREAFGRLPAFLYGWIRLVVVTPASLGAIALIFAGYARSFLPLDAGGERVLAAGLLVALALLNLRSVIWTAVVENVASALKVAALVLLAAFLVGLGSGEGGALRLAAGAGPGTGGGWTSGWGGWGGFGVGLAAAMWSYSGWGTTTKMAGEVRDPERSIPRALFWGVTTVTMLYLGVNAALLHVLPVETIAASSDVASEAARAVLGAAGGEVVAALVLLSTFGALNALILANSRLLYAMAEDRLFFAPVARLHPTFRTPHVSVLVTAALGVAYVSLGTFSELVEAFILGEWPFHMAVAAAVLLLRHREGPASGYRVPAGPVIPLLFLLTAGGMILTASLEQPGPAVISFGAILLGAPAYWLLGLGRKGGDAGS